MKQNAKKDEAESALRTSERQRRPHARAGKEVGGNPDQPAARWSASTCAITAERRFAVGRWRNSLGPCAFECGPSTPVTTNCARGNFAPSIAMNGMLPPSPI